MSEDDRLWNEDRERNGWTLPFKASWPLRLPVVRIFRAMYHDFRMQSFVEQWAMTGVGLGVPNQYDLWVLYAIRRGWC